MNILDENVINPQHLLLRSWGIPVRQIGFEIGRKGIQDEELIPLLRRLNRPTFLTLDEDFYRRTLVHANCCLACFAVETSDLAAYIRRFLRHPEFRVAARRMGSVVRVTDTGLRYWRLHAPEIEIPCLPDTRKSRALPSSPTTAMGVKSRQHPWIHHHEACRVMRCPQWCGIIGRAVRGSRMDWSRRG